MSSDAVVRPLQWPGPYQNQLSIVVKNSSQLAQKPTTLPPSPQIIDTLKGTSTGFQFSFNQVQVPTGYTNVISSYRVYRNTVNVANRNLVHTFAHDPTHQGKIVFSDVITQASALNYYYWVTSVDTFGQESAQQPAQSGTVQGSAGSIPFSTSTSFTYTATTTSITWYWDGTNGSSPLTIYRADGTTTGPLSGNQAITGLTNATTYNFYPYYDETTKSLAWVAGGSGTPAYAQPSAGSKALVQSQNLRTRIPLSIGGMQASTGAGGSGSGGGGGGGGGCFTGNVKVKTSDGFVRFDELRFLVEVETLNGPHLAHVVSHEEYTDDVVDMGEGQLVTFRHRVLHDGSWIPAHAFFPASYNRGIFKGTVYNLHILSDKEDDHHYILENGLVAHNLNKF